MIADRPAEVDDRAVPGHWEGDLIIGKNSASAIGTLVERTTRFMILLHLPGRHGAEQRPRRDHRRQIGTLPEHLRRSLTWDQGIEMARHTARSPIATGLADLLLRPRLPLATRQQREHQRAAAPVLPQGHRPVRPQRRRPR